MVSLLLEGAKNVRVHRPHTPDHSGAHAACLCALVLLCVARAHAMLCGGVQVRIAQMESEKERLEYERRMLQVGGSAHTSPDPPPSA